MKTSINFFNQFPIKVVSLFLLATCFINISCSARNSSPQYTKDTNQTDSVICSVIGDSIYSIIKNSKNITATIKIKNSDNKISSHKIKLSKDNIIIANFLISSSDNYLKNDTVFGKFNPNFSIKFKLKNNEINTNFDFGLKKWNICDENGVEYFVFNLANNEMLRLANLIFPKNEFINKLLNDTTK